MDMPSNLRDAIMTSPSDRASGLQEIHPRWDLRQSEAGRWWAHRRDDLTVDQMRAGCRMTLDADDLEDLALLLTQQDKMTAPHAVIRATGRGLDQESRA
jgi:hypothetical protein